MKHLKYLIAAVIVGSAFFGVAHAQVGTVNLWKPNVPSSTITPINSSLQVPCANIQGGCGLSSSTAVTSLNAATGTVTVVGTSTATVSTTVSTSGGTITVSSSLPQSVATSASPTFAGVIASGSSTLNGVSNTGNVTSTSYTAANPTSTVNFASGINFDTVLYASTNEQGLDHGTYVNTLCQAGLTNASSVNVIFPQENIASGNWTVPIIDSYNGGACTYTGQGPYSTIWNWGGTTSTAATAENAGDANVLWGYGMNNLSIYGYYTAAAPGLLIGGANPGGGQGFSNNNLVIKYFANDEVIATNTYLGMQTGGYIGAASTSALTYNSVSNAGEGLLFDHVTFADTVQPSSTVQNCILIQGGFSQIEFTNSHFDDCGQTITSAASYGTEVLTADYWENTLGDTIGAYIPIQNQSTGVTVEAYGGQDTNDASSSVSPGGFITNSGTFINNGMTAFQNSTGVQTRFVTDNSTGNDYDYGFSNPNGAVSHYKAATTQTGQLVYSATVANSYPYSISVTATTTYVYSQNGTTPVETINTGHTNIGSGAIATTTIYIAGSQGGLSGVTNLSSTLTTASGKWIFFTGPAAASATLPAWNVSQGADFVVTDDSTSSAYQLQAATTTTDSIQNCLTGATSTFILLPKEASTSSIEVINDGITTGVWRTLCTAY